MVDRIDRRIALQTSHNSITASPAYHTQHAQRQNGFDRGSYDNEVREDVICPECERTMSKLNICVCGKCIMRCCTCPVCGCR